MMYTFLFCSACFNQSQMSNKSFFLMGIVFQRSSALVFVLFLMFVQSLFIVFVGPRVIVFVRSVVSLHF